MSLASTHERLRLPDGLQRQLLGFRRRVWTVKMAEAAGEAVFVVLAAYLLMFALDRAFDTPPWARAALLAAALAGCALVPWALRCWVWKNRRFDQLARLLGRKHPAMGDQLLGTIELVNNDLEQSRSWELCEAAVRETAERASGRDFSDAVPSPRHRRWLALATVPLAGALALAWFAPEAASSAWARLLAPLGSAPRYTFAALDPLPAEIVVPHGEPFQVAARLAPNTFWKPGRGEARFEGQPAVAAALDRDGRFIFKLPAQIEARWLSLRIGDARRRVRIVPTLRPELKSIVARVALPAYLKRTEDVKKDVRGGAVSLVEGSRAVFQATATRALESARVDGQSRVPEGATIASPATLVKGPRTMEFQWRDANGLEGKEPFALAIQGRADEPPTITCENLPRQKVVLDSEALNFQIRTQDDFGVKRVGMEWRGAEDPVEPKPARGERALAAGGPDKTSLEVAGTFSAKSLGIGPQAVQVRLFVEDYLPDRPRVYSPTFTLFVLNPQQHAVWLTEQLSRWHRQAMDVRDRELQLYENNKRLRALGADELDRPESRRRIEKQAGAERQNGRRLSGLVTSGDDLVRQAMRNPEFGVGHLEKWAEMLQVLKDISGKRMPSVADLLKDAAQAPAKTAGQPSKSNERTAMVGQARASGTGKLDAQSPDAKKDQPAIPRIVDMESSQNSPAEKTAASQPPPNKGGPPPLKLPVTTLLAKPNGKEAESCPTEQKLDEAVGQQRDLLAEFEKIADELNRVLANLEGSTLLKRLKAAARLQYKIGGRINDQIAETFGASGPPSGGAGAKVMNEMSEQEARSSHDVSLIMDDMQSYFERRRFVRFQTVLDEMRSQDVIGALRQLGDDLKTESGISIAQCDFWSDTLDRWAEDLVDPASGGT